MAITGHKFLQDLGKQMVRLRKGQNLTQAQMAELLGISQQLIGFYEYGVRSRDLLLPDLRQALRSRLKREENTMLEITKCPTCESRRIKRVKKNQRRTFKGQAYVVPRLEYWECPDCGEHVYDHDAMRKIEVHSPAYPKQRRAAAQ